MTSSYYYNNNITSLSLALLEDSSWYKANYKHAIIPSFGHGAGCGFLEGDCLLSSSTNKIPSYSKEFFCSLQEENHYNTTTTTITSKKSGCDVSHLAKAECNTDSSSINDIFHVLLQNRPNTNNVYTLQQTISTLEENDSTYTCPMRTKNAISCLDTTQTPLIHGEVFGTHSKCFDTTTSSICLYSNCNPHTHKIEIYYNENEYICNHPGQKIHLLSNYHNNNHNNDIIIECPKIETVCPNIICPANCSGKGMCDYSLDVPICICDDPYDTSPGCWTS